VLSTIDLTNEQLAIFIQNGKAEYIPQLWENCCKLLYKLGNAFYLRFSERCFFSGITLDDIHQECFLVMLAMVKAYSPDKEYKFLSYANFQFSNQMRFLLHHGGNYAENPLNLCKSLSESVEGLEDEEITLQDMLKDENAELAYSNIDELVYQSQLHNALMTEINAVLTDKEKRLIEQRFFGNITYKAIGEVEQITSMAVIEREKRALNKLKRHNYVSKRLDSFREEIILSKDISSLAYNKTGLNSFKNNLASSVELAFEKSVFIS